MLKEKFIENSLFDGTKGFGEAEEFQRNSKTVPVSRIVIFLLKKENWNIVQVFLRNAKNSDGGMALNRTLTGVLLKQGEKKKHKVVWKGFFFC